MAELSRQCLEAEWIVDLGAAMCSVFFYLMHDSCVRVIHHLFSLITTSAFRAIPAVAMEAQRRRDCKPKRQNKTFFSPLRSEVEQIHGSTRPERFKTGCHSRKLEQKYIPSGDASAVTFYQVKGYGFEKPNILFQLNGQLCVFKHLSS